MSATIPEALGDRSAADLGRTEVRVKAYDPTDRKRKAAISWYGYGRWEAPFWFVGMEPGGEDSHASYDSWWYLGGDELIDCRAHHIDSNRRAGRIITNWHREEDPPTQPTWRRLIQLLLAFKGAGHDIDDVRAYQRDNWGSVGGETAVIEVSALHAVGLDTNVERELYRNQRIATIAKRLVKYKPTLVVMYGLGYRDLYERIAGGAFDSRGYRWHGETLCVIVEHPVARIGRAADWWPNLGTEIATTLQSP